MKDKLITLGIMVAAIFVTGFILEEMGSGKYGALPQNIAKKVTSGYGV